MNVYTTPEMEIIEFESEDIVTGSILYNDSEEMPVLGG